MQDILDHIGFPVRDYAASMAFYKAVLAPLGISLLKEYNLSEDGADGYAGFGRTRPQFWIGTGEQIRDACTSPLRPKIAKRLWRFITLL